MSARIRLLLLLQMVILTATATAQDRAAGPWWPHPLWGAEDQAGGSNWITPDKILQAVQLVTTGKLYELGQIYEADMPIFGNRTYAMHIPEFPYRWTRR